MVGEGVLLLVLAFIPSLLISFNIAHMDLIDTYQLPFTWLRFAICGGITFVLIVLMIICGVWYPPARQLAWSRRRLCITSDQGSVACFRECPITSQMFVIGHFFMICLLIYSCLRLWHSIC